MAQSRTEFLHLHWPPDPFPSFASQPRRHGGKGATESLHLRCPLVSFPSILPANPVRQANRVDKLTRFIL